MDEHQPSELWEWGSDDASGRVSTADLSKAAPCDDDLATSNHYDAFADDYDASADDHDASADDHNASAHESSMGAADSGATAESVDSAASAQVVSATAASDHGATDLGSGRCACDLGSGQNDPSAGHHGHDNEACLRLGHVNLTGIHLGAAISCSGYLCCLCARGLGEG
mmetsp:Transcript_62825/g.128053  ORF Transcript_62825/g.128053 Transcript_62825/m.128053 type:complete len:169 (+) Transcript_62825:477-983(+)